MSETQTCPNCARLQWRADSAWSRGYRMGNVSNEIDVLNITERLHKEREAHADTNARLTEDNMRQEHDLAVARAELGKVADYVEPHWRGAGLPLAADWILHELAGRADKREAQSEELAAARAEIEALRKAHSELFKLARIGIVALHPYEFQEIRDEARDDVVAASETGLGDSVRVPRRFLESETFHRRAQERILRRMAALAREEPPR